MSFKRSLVQVYIESLFPGPQGAPFKGLPKKTVETTSIDSIKASKIAEKLNEDCSSYYYKALLSYMESLPAICMGSYSWATVRLYYSAFYATKAFLAAENIAVFRAERKMYYIKANNGESFQKCCETTDHKATFEVLKKEVGTIDLLLSNMIDNKITYEWMMEKREEVNYKDIDFHDPDPPEFWEKICEYIANKKYIIEKLIDLIVQDDKWLYCFQPDYGVLGIPTKRLFLTTEAIRHKGKKVSLDDNKKYFIETFSNELSAQSQHDLIFWK